MTNISTAVPRGARSASRDAVGEVCHFDSWCNIASYSSLVKVGQSLMFTLCDPSSYNPTVGTDRVFFSLCPLLSASCTQIGAWVSDQSEPIASREKMEIKAKEIEVSNPPRRASNLHVIYEQPTGGDLLYARFVRFSNAMFR